jgi:hypothetical protein
VQGLKVDPCLPCAGDLVAKDVRYFRFTMAHRLQLECLIMVCSLMPIVDSMLDFDLMFLAGHILAGTIKVKSGLHEHADPSHC